MRVGTEKETEPKPTPPRRRTNSSPSLVFCRSKVMTHLRIPKGVFLIVLFRRRRRRGWLLLLLVLLLQRLLLHHFQHGLHFWGQLLLRRRLCIVRAIDGRCDGTAVGGGGSSTRSRCGGRGSLFLAALFLFRHDGGGSIDRADSI